MWEKPASRHKKSLSVEGTGAEQGWYQTGLSAFFDSHSRHAAMDSYSLGVQIKLIKLTVPHPSWVVTPYHSSTRKGLVSESGHSDPFLFAMTSVFVAA